jgi:hypothetical protein
LIAGDRRRVVGRDRFLLSSELDAFVIAFIIGDDRLDRR